jgi:hypothetical protein
MRAVPVAVLSVPVRFGSDEVQRLDHVQVRVVAVDARVDAEVPGVDLAARHLGRGPGLVGRGADGDDPVEVREVVVVTGVDAGTGRRHLCGGAGDIRVGRGAVAVEGDDLVAVFGLRIEPPVAIRGHVCAGLGDLLPGAGLPEPPLDAEAVLIVRGIGPGEVDPVVADGGGGESSRVRGWLTATVDGHRDAVSSTEVGDDTVTFAI